MQRHDRAAPAPFLATVHYPRPAPPPLSAPPPPSPAPLVIASRIALLAHRNAPSVANPCANARRLACKSARERKLTPHSLDCSLGLSSAHPSVGVPQPRVEHVAHP